MIHGIGQSISGFVAGVAGTSESEVRHYAEEIQNNRRFHEAMESKRWSPEGRRFPQACVNDEVGAILYSICRTVRPDNVVETGVASGVSTSYLLCALEENGHGRLHSIDYPTFEPDTGWIVPDYLKYRWDLLVGRSSARLEPLLDRLESIAVFFHDSEHTYENMMWEYETAWTHLLPGGILLSHNIDFTDAFPDFCEKMGVRSWVYQNLGGVMKE